VTQRSKIEWTDASWNPVTGCTKVSAGCQRCYAERMALRLKAMGRRTYARGFKLTLHPHLLHLPLSWKKPRMVFVNSMSDLFHEQVPLSFTQRVFEVMRQADGHTYQILTKRSARLLELDSVLPWAPHVWMGVTVENADYTHRIDDLLRTHAAIRFLSLEPLLGPIPHLQVEGIHWVIVGGESGPGARPMDPTWVREIRQQCLDAKVPFFFKGWGGRTVRAGGRLLDGRKWNEMPET
jgi:protein gp37